MSQVGDTLKYVVSTLQPDGTFATNVFYANHQAGGTTGSAGEVTDAIIWLTDIFTPLLPLMTPVFVVDSFKVYLYNQVTGLFDPRETGVLGLAGTDLGNALPNVNAAYSRAFSDDPRSTSTKYWPAMAENEVGGNNIDVAALAAIINTLVVWSFQWAGGGSRIYAPVCWSKKDSVAKLLTGTTILNTIISHQNRRKPNVGS